MHKLAVVTAVVVCATAVASTPSRAAVGQNILAPADATAPIEKVGCYRLGETGYHWYHSCFGPWWLYPHHRVCRHGACWYR
jgi:hypothetical protein